MHIFNSSGDIAGDSEGDEHGGGGESRHMEDSFDDDDAEEEEGEDEAAEQELGEATVRLVRLFANLCINEEIGVQLAKRKDTINVRNYHTQVWCHRAVIHV